MTFPNPFNKFKKPTPSYQYWSLPPIGEVVDMLRLKAGSIKEFLDAVTQDELEQQQLLFLIEEELEKEGNEAELKRWKKYHLLYLRAQLAKGTEAVISLYSRGNLDKHQFVNGLGKNILPDLFDPAKAGLAAKDAEESAIDRELKELNGDS